MWYLDVNNSLAWVPLVKPVRSSVSPAGTARPSSVIVRQLVLAFIADAASVKVQLVALFSGLAPGEGTTAEWAAPALRRRARKGLHGYMVVGINQKGNNNTVKEWLELKSDVNCYVQK